MSGEGGGGGSTDFGGGGKGGGGGGGGGGDVGGGDAGKGGGSSKGGGGATADGGGFGGDYGAGSNYTPSPAPAMDSGIGSYDSSAGGGTGYDVNPWSSGGAMDIGGAGGAPAYSDPYAGSGGLPPEITGGSSGGNLGGPGPVGGDIGMPDAGGGTNTWGNFPGLSGQEFDYLNTSQPVTAGGVSSVGSSAGIGDSAAGPQSLDLMLDPNSIVTDAGGTGMAGGLVGSGTSAAATAAPTGVAGNPQLDASSRDRVQGGGTNQMQAAQGRGLLESLGLTGTNGLGAAVAGAGLLNNLINGQGDTASSDALRGLAMENQARRAEIAGRSAPQQEAGARVSAAGEQQIAQGQQITRQGQDIISSGQNQLPGGQVLQQYVQNGTLPAAYESQVQQGLSSAITNIRARHASRGMSTDPAQNSVLAEEIRQVEARAPEMRMQLAQSLANTGTGIVGSANQTIGAGTGVVSGGNQTTGAGGSLVNTGTQTANSLVDEGLRATGLSADIYRALLTDENARNQRRGTAIANFASALNNTPRNRAA